MPPEEAALRVRGVVARHVGKQVRRAPPGARSEKSAGAKENPVTMEVLAMSTMAMVATDGKDIRKNPVTDTKGGQSKGTTGQMVIWCRGSFSQLLTKVVKPQPF